MSSVQYLVFDTETVADGDLIARVRYTDRNLDPDEATARYRAELLQSQGTDFIPYTFQLPISVAVAKVGPDFRLQGISVLDSPRYRSHVITQQFWRGWEKYKCPTWVSFNGRGFDMPVMEQAAFRFGIAVPKWFNLEAKSYEQARNRYNLQSHLDLMDLMTNFGATRFPGGLNLAANLLGKPGKIEVQGHMVQDLYDEGRVQEINDYCKCDTLDTYFVFLRTRVLLGKLTLPREQELVQEVKQWVIRQAETDHAYQLYLSKWRDWPDPWPSEEGILPANYPDGDPDDPDSDDFDDSVEADSHRQHSQPNPKTRRPTSPAHGLTRQPIPGGLEAPQTPPRPPGRTQPGLF